MSDFNFCLVAEKRQSRQFTSTISQYKLAEDVAKMEVQIALNEVQIIIQITIMFNTKILYNNLLDIQ
jgi:hypothetical protein